MDRWDSASDEDLLAATRRDPDAFGVFYRRHEEAMLRYFLGRLGDPELAADLCAETFAGALLSSRRFRSGPEPARAWLFGVARNTLSASVRRRRVAARARRRLDLPQLALTDEVIDRVAALADPALARMEELPDTQREAIRARVLEEREYAEIARELRCSEAVARKRVSRGLSTLREQAEEGTR
jgi:RNA polymerase sigma-70 factor (ECF subfamily)